MCRVVTKSGNGKERYLGENIHLLYTDNNVAKKNLYRQIAAIEHVRKIV